MSHLHYSSSDYLVVFGGILENKLYSDELWIYNMSQSSWSIRKNNLDGLLFPIAQHAAAVVNESILYVFGGKVMNGSESSLSTSIFRFSFKSNSWQHVVVDAGGIPPWILRRAGHSMIYDAMSHSLIVFGGYQIDGRSTKVKRSQQLFIFDINRSFWAEISSSNQPKPMAYHTASVVGDYMVIIGGSVHTHETDETCYSNVVYFYHLRCNTWHSRPHPIGIKPMAQYSHVAATNNNLIFVHGGYTGTVSNLLLAYQVPLYAVKNISNVCRRLSRNDCLRNQRCAWSGKASLTDRCIPLNQSSINDLTPSCPGFCDHLSTCSSCTTFSRFVNLLLICNTLW